MSVRDSTAGMTARTTARRFEPTGTARGRASVSVVIPALDEAANLPHVFARIPASIHEVILVDGHSRDGTIDIARTIRPDVRVVLQNGRGKGNALACGFAAATGDIIVMIDADASNDPAEIPRFVDALLEGHDFAKGSRFASGGASADITPLRHLGNRVLGIAVNLLFRTRYTDLCYGFNAFWRHCLPHMHVTCDGFEVETLIHVRVARAGLAVAEVASVEHERLHGESKLSATRDGLRILRLIVRERVRRGAVGHAEGWRPPYRELPLAAHGIGASADNGRSERRVSADDRRTHVGRSHAAQADLSPAG
jgi:glycosyltransferase involved in cell wall biosynthesis